MNKILLVLLFIINIYGINLDPYLLQHSIYASKELAINSESSLPKSGIIGTPGSFGYTGGWKCKLYTKMIVDTLTGTKDIELDDGTTIAGIYDPGTQYGMWEQMSVQTSGDLEYVTNMKSSTPNNNGGTINQVSQVYPVEPQLPDLSNIQFSSGSNINSNGTYMPGSYNKLTSTCTLRAGIYYFNSIDLPDNDTIYISSNNGSYATEIYVKNHINIGVKSVLIQTNTNDGKGSTLLALRGDEAEKQIDDQHVNGTIYIRDNAFVSATILAPTSRVMLRNKASISGQVFAEKIHFIGFDGGSDLEYVSYNKVNVIVDSLVYNEDDGDTIISITLADKVSDSTGFINWKILDSTAVFDDDMNNTYSKSGIIYFQQDSTNPNDQIHIDIKDDNVNEGTEYLKLLLYNSSDNIDLGGQFKEYVITIKDNDFNTHPPVVISDTITCKESDSVTWNPTVTDPD